MRNFNIVLWLVPVLIIWIMLILVTPAPVWIWWVMLAAVVGFYKPAVDSLNRRLWEREEEIASQTAIIENLLKRAKE